MADRVEDQGHYTHRLGSVNGVGNDENPLHESSIFPLFTERGLEDAIRELREMLDEDKSNQTQEALKGAIAQQIGAFAGDWFQRIDYPKHHITSTSNHDWAWIDEGGLNTLGKRLTSEEASILRPWPKWFYIRNVLPDLSNKAVLEIGSSNGFFCFRFSELGAAQVTGIEIVRRQYESALWSASVLERDNVSFLNTDALLDMTIPEYDIVFLSEVHNHFLFPFYGLVRMINLARETVIFDTGAIDSADHRLALYSGWDKQSKRLIYHSFMLSDGLIMDFLALIGVPMARVQRYKALADHHHILYVIDTKNLDRHRIEFGYPEYLKEVIDLRIKA